MKSKGYTLWLMPREEAYTFLAQLIKKLALEYNGPIFEPHVTLLGDIELSEEDLVKKTGQLVRNQQSFPVFLEQIGYEDFFFRTLFVKAKLTDPLTTLHKKAKKIFEMENIPSYMAHLSLLYGNYPTNLKEKIIAEIGREQNVKFEVKSIFLIKGGDVKDWKIIKEFSFS